jgi:C1A family cysteine protease
MSLGIRNKFISGIRLCILMGSVFLCVSIPHAVAQESLAPLNPEFLEYQQNLQKFLSQNTTSSNYVVGYLPSPLNLSHLTGQPLFQISEQTALPSSYDLRNLGKLTPVGNQGDCSSDWTFASYGSLESCLLPSETWDFSENNLKNTHGFDLGHCDGGNANMSIAYLARWSGPVSEADDPYTTSSNASPLGLDVRKHIQEVLVIPGRANSLDNENIKQAIMTYGAVYTSMYFRNNYYSIAHKTYYYYGTASSNRSVAIVGWDDNFNKNKFLIGAPGDGAFIIKNSLGTNWGEEGYFYVSYYDSKIGTENYVFSNAEPATNYQRVYQYDPLGWLSSLGYDSNAAWFGNIFTSVEDERLEAISFYTASPNSSYEIYIYSNADSGPTSGSLSASQMGIIPFPGYHTIDLNKPIVLTLHQKFSIVVKLTTPGFNYPIPIEYPIAGYSSQATANPGESYISVDGTVWKDLTSSIVNANVCLKAFTIDMSPPQTMITSGVIDSKAATFTYTGSDDITPTADLLYATSLQGYDSAWSSFSSSTSKSYTDLPDGLYIFQVKAKDQAGNEDPTPATHSFTILSPPGQATLISPSGTITTMTPSFTWNGVSSATDYLLWVDDPTGTKIQQWYTAEAAGCVSGTGTCSVTPSVTLAAGSCTWWIQCKNSAGTGPLSISMAFAVEIVSAPTIPSGPTTGTPGTSYTYSTGGASSNLGHSVQYLFDWGDGTNSGWLPVGTTSASKSWESGGTYAVKAQARCATHTSAVSGWSVILSVDIEVISTPTTPSGLTSGIAGTSYTYSTGGASSNLGHSVQYLFDWGDGTNSGWLPAGTTSTSKSWVLPGVYSVKVKARCATHNWIISSWSTALDVSMKRVTVLQPNGGEVIPPGKTYTIEWTAPTQAVKFKLLYSMDNGATWILITRDATGTSYDWTVPKPASHANSCYVKVVGYSASNVNVGEDKSDKPFAIGLVKLFSPNGGEVLESGEIYQIQWEINGTKYPVATQKLYYTMDGGTTWSLITTLDASFRTYEWIPLVKITKTKCKVKVVIYDTKGVAAAIDMSDAYFIIQP